jgi:hypothetical protein
MGAIGFVHGKCRVAPHHHTKKQGKNQQGMHSRRAAHFQRALGIGRNALVNKPLSIAPTVLAGRIVKD